MTADFGGTLGLVVGVAKAALEAWVRYLAAERVRAERWRERNRGASS